ncbi:MAG: hypothetical protein M0P50_15515, partial [Bacteroidales bacterium]|nr:hypothetical protein [Bacteroidales bacterium]
FNGAMRMAQGGKFEHGFLSGFVSSLGGSAMIKYGGNMDIGSKVALSAALGGTAEALGGGKFANGAVTGAYVMMFNHLQENIQEKKAERKFTKSIPKETLAAMTPEQRKSFYQLYRQFTKDGFSFENHETFIEGMQNLSDFWDYSTVLVGIEATVLAAKIAPLFAIVGLVSTTAVAMVSSSFDNIVYSYNLIPNNPSLGVFVKHGFTPTSYDLNYYNAATGDYLGKVSLPRQIQR